MEESCSGIYEIVCIPTGERYIGRATKFRIRWTNHRYLLRKSKHKTSRLQEVWDKYGEGAFEFRVVETCSTEYSVLKTLEQLYLDAYRDEGKRELLLNKSLQADGPSFFSEKTRALMSKGNKGKVCKPEAIAATAAANRGSKRSEQARKNMSASRIGRTLSDTHKANISKALAGRTLKPQHVENLASKSRGRKHTAIARANMSAGQLRYRLRLREMKNLEIACPKEPSKNSPKPGPTSDSS